MLDLSCMVGYVGPGAGLSMLGALLAVSGLIVFALLAPLLYFVRLIRVMLQRHSATQPAIVPSHLRNKS